MINGLGYIDIEGIEDPSLGFYVLLNGQRFTYLAQVSLHFVIQENGQFKATDHENKMTGQLKPLPLLTSAMLCDFKQMIDNKIVPYQNPPSGTPKSLAALKALADEKYPGEEHGFYFALCLYDWTSPDFIRLDVFNQLTYSGLPGLPMDIDSLAATIWACDYPYCTAKNADFMNMFLMQPANSKAEVKKQLLSISKKMQGYAFAETSLQTHALLKLPKVSTHDYPLLYRGGMAISGNLLADFAPSLLEYPGNNGPTTTPLLYSFKKALSNMLKQGSIITTKTPWSFSNDLKGAKVWQRGILMTCKPPTGAKEWPAGADITDFSLNPDTFEVNFPRDTRFEIETYEWITIKDKPVCHFTLRMLGYYGQS